MANTEIKLASLGTTPTDTDSHIKRSPQKGDRSKRKKQQEAFSSVLSEQTLVSPQRERRLRRLAEDFFEAVCASERFSWMGFFETRDELQRPRLVVYLEEYCRSAPDAAGYRGGTTISRELTPLALALRPQIFLDLYYSRAESSGDPVGRAREDITLRYAGDRYKPKAKLLWQV